MQLEITIKYSSGDTATYVAYPPDLAKWEKETGKSLSEFSGIWDTLFVAYSAMKREAAGQVVKPFEVWTDTVIDLDLKRLDPKATQKEV